MLTPYVWAICAVAIGAASALEFERLCPNETWLNGRAVRTRYWDSDCTVVTRPSPSRANATEDLNLVVVSPYSGALADVMSMAEPFLAMAAQEVEESSLLPGYRVRLHLVDSKCSATYAQSQVIRALFHGEAKHGLIGDSCSSCCKAINPVLSVKHLLHLSPACIDDQLSSYPFLARLSPGFSQHVDAMYDLVKMLQWRRFGILTGPQKLVENGRDRFLKKVEEDSEYGWTMLFQQQVRDSADADMAAAMAKDKDARIIVQVIYEDLGVKLLCSFHQLGLFAPEYVWIQLSGWWNPDVLEARADEVPCTTAQLWRAAFGSIGADRSGAVLTPLRHGLSGRPVDRIFADYEEACSSFGDGTVGCGSRHSHYFYDAVWHFAWLLHEFLHVEGRPLSELTSAQGLERMFDLSTSLDYLGITDHVRQYAHGGRDGTILLWQVQPDSPVSTPFTLVGHWTSTSTKLFRPLYWDLDNSSMESNCSNSTCSGWIPPDRSDACPPGHVWSNLEGCSQCREGTYSTVGDATCSRCDVGTYSNATGRSACTACPPGKFTKELGASRCTSCQSGTFVDLPGASQCLNCPRGTFADREHSTECERCLDLPFPFPTTPDVASRSADDCACPERFYRPLVGSSCLPCGTGLECRVGTVEVSQSPVAPSGGMDLSFSNHPRVQPGYYTSRQEPLSVFRCAHREQCPGMLPETCSLHHLGTACGQCEPGYVMSTKGTCLKCSTLQGVIPILAGVSVTLVPCVIAVSAWFVREDASYWGHPSRSILSAVFIGMTYTQTIAMHTQMDLTLPVPFESTTSSVGYSLSPLQVFSLECSGIRDPSIDFVARMCMPVYIAVVFSLAYGLSRLVDRLVPGRFEHVGDSVISMYGNFYNVLFMAIASQTFSLFMCYDHPNGKSSLHSMSYILCGEGVWGGLVGASVGAILLFCVLAMAVMAWLLWISPSRYHDKAFRLQTKFLHFRFRTEFGFWSLVLLFRNTWVILSVVISSHVTTQFMWLTLGLMAYAFASACVCPFRAMANSILDVVTHAGALYVFSCSSFLISDEAVDFEPHGLRISWLALSVYLSIAVAVFWQLWLWLQVMQNPGFNKKEAERICDTMSLMSKHPSLLAEVMEHLSYPELHAFQQAERLIQREVGLKGGLRAGQSSITFDALQTSVLRTSLQKVQAQRKSIGIDASNSLPCDPSSCEDGAAQGGAGQGRLKNSDELFDEFFQHCAAQDAEPAKGEPELAKGEQDDAHKAAKPESLPPAPAWPQSDGPKILVQL